MNFFKGSWICFTSGGRVGNIGVARSFLFIRFLRFFLFEGGIICFTFPCEEERPRATRIPRGVVSSSLTFFARGGDFIFSLCFWPFFFFYFYFYSILLIP